MDTRVKPAYATLARCEAMRFKSCSNFYSAAGISRIQAGVFMSPAAVRRTDQTSVSRNRLILVVYTAAIFTSALLLFSVQPLFTKMVLPRLGGSPAVWSVAMVFFQSLLLGGYAYAHYLMQIRNRIVPVAVHLVLLAIALLTLPLSIANGWGEPPTSGYAFWLLGLFAVSIGLPFFRAGGQQSAAAGVVRPHRTSQRPRSVFPVCLVEYRQFPGAAVLSGAAGADVHAAHPEPDLDLRLWPADSADRRLRRAVAALAGQCGGRTQDDDADAPAPTWALRSRWIFLAAVPSGLLIAVTAHISTDVAAAPLLWVLPLSLYLLTWVLVFQSRPLLPHRWMLMLQPLAIAGVIVLLAVGGEQNLLLTLGGHQLCFFVIAMACHGELARTRPAVGISHRLLCGAVVRRHGRRIVRGADRALHIFVDRRISDPAGAGRAVPPARDERLPRWSRWYWPFLAVARGGADRAVLVSGKCLLDGRSPGLGDRRRRRSFSFADARIECQPLEDFRDRRCRAGADPRLSGGRRTRGNRAQLLRRPQDRGDAERAVSRADARHHDPRRREIRNDDGTPVTGRPEAISYYHKDGGIGQAISAIRERKGGPIRVAVIGLGAGTLTCASEPGEQWKFFEIDQSMVDTARDPKYFTFIQNCEPDLKPVIGDARLTFAKEPDGIYDLIIVDAYSSDAIPIHLATEEAMEIYKHKLAPQGAVVMHVSNRHLELSSVVVGIADANDLESWVYSGIPAATANTSSRLGGGVRARRGRLGALASSDVWELTEPEDNQRVWTDDYSNVLGAVWRRLRDGEQ